MLEGAHFDVAMEKVRHLETNFKIHLLDEFANVRIVPKGVSFYNRAFWLFVFIFLL